MVVLLLSCRHHLILDLFLHHWCCFLCFCGEIVAFIILFLFLTLSPSFISVISVSFLLPHTHALRRSPYHTTTTTTPSTHRSSTPRSTTSRLSHDIVTLTLVVPLRLGSSSIFTCPFFSASRLPYLFQSIPPWTALFSRPSWSSNYSVIGPPLPLLDVTSPTLHHHLIVSKGAIYPQLSSIVFSSRFFPEPLLITCLMVLPFHSFLPLCFTFYLSYFSSLPSH